MQISLLPFLFKYFRVAFDIAEDITIAFSITSVRNADGSNPSLSKKLNTGNDYYILNPKHTTQPLSLYA